jgi:hypothetical protein
MGLFTERDEETPNEIIIGKLNRIEAKLDAVIKAMHDYDGNDEYGESSFEAFIDTQGGSYVGNEHNIDAEAEMIKYAEEEMEKEAERRMDIIGQNGNEGLHYDSHHVTNEEADEDAATFNDYGMRVGKDKNNDTQDKRTVREKDKHVGKKKRDKWVSPYPPNPKRKFTQDLIPKNK